MQAALRMINTGNKFGLEEQIRSRQLSRAGMNKTSVGDLLGCLAQGESSDLVSQRRVPANPGPSCSNPDPSANPGAPSHTPSKQMLWQRLFSQRKIVLEDGPTCK